MDNFVFWAASIGSFASLWHVINSAFDHYYVVKSRRNGIAKMGTRVSSFASVILLIVNLAFAERGFTYYTSEVLNFSFFGAFAIIGTASLSCIYLWFHAWLQKAVRNEHK